MRLIQIGLTSAVFSFPSASLIVTLPAGSLTNSVSAMQSGTFTLVDSTPAGSAASLVSSPEALRHKQQCQSQNHRTHRPLNRHPSHHSITPETSQDQRTAARGLAIIVAKNPRKIAPLCYRAAATALDAPNVMPLTVKVRQSDVASTSSPDCRKSNTATGINFKHDGSEAAYASRMWRWKASISRRVSGPDVPDPMTRPSIRVTGITSAAVPVRKHSSAMYTSCR